MKVQEPQTKIKIQKMYFTIDPFQDRYADCILGLRSNIQRIFPWDYMKAKT